MPAAKPDIVLLAVEPAIAPGLMVQFPAGNPLNTTLPVDTAQLGWVIRPANGDIGVTGCASITTSVDADEVHPAALVTV